MQAFDATSFLGHYLPLKDKPLIGLHPETSGYLRPNIEKPLSDRVLVAANFFNDMKRIGKYIFNMAARSTNARKALELYLFVKNVYKTSTIPNFTYKELSNKTGLCFSSLKKRIGILKQAGLVERTGKNKQHLLFKSARKKRNNIRIDQIDLSSIKEIGKGLCALFIVEIQCRKEYIKQLLNIYHACRENEYLCRRYNYKKIERKVRKRGLLNCKFQDNGISYNYISKALKIGFNKVSEAIKYAERHNMLMVERKRIVQLCHAKGNGHAIVKYASDSKNIFATNNNVYIMLANRYHLPMDGSWYGIY